MTTVAGPRQRRQPQPVQRDTLTIPQWSIYEAGWKPEARFRAACCGRRVGKTYLLKAEMRRAAVMAVRMKAPVDQEIWYGAPTAKQAKRVFWRALKRTIPAAWIQGKPNESELSITLKTGHVMRVVGLENFEALRGSGLWFFAGDEWADCPYAAWTEVIRPMLSSAARFGGGHAIWVGTPKGFNHFYDAWQQGQPGASKEHDHQSWLYTTEQGGNVPREEISAAMRMLDARTFEQEYRAGFVNFAGRVLFAFTRGDSVRLQAYDPTTAVDVGMDFNVNPMTAVILQTVGGVDHQVGEIILPTSNTDEMAAELKRRYGRGGSVGHITVHPDPAGAQRRTSAQGRTDIQILRDAGFRVQAMSSHPLVRDRLNVTNARFCAADGTTRRLFVDPSCTKSIEAYERLTYREGGSEPDKQSGYDHVVDALGYWAVGKHAYKAPATRTVNVMGR